MLALHALPRRQPRQRIAAGSSVRLSQLHLSGSRLGLNALQCDASDGVICGRAGLQRRMRAGQSRKLSLPVLSRAEAESIEIGGGLAAGLGGLGGALDQEVPVSFSIGSPMNFRRRSPPTACRAAADEVLTVSVEPGSSAAPAAAVGDAAAAAAAESAPSTSERGAEVTSGGGDAQDASSAEPAANEEGEPPVGNAERASEDAESEPKAESEEQDPESEPQDAEKDGQCEGAVGGDGASQEASAEDAENKRKVFVGNMPFTASKSRIWSLFEQFGKVVKVHLVRNPTNGKSRGFGFITFETEEGAKNALAADGAPPLFLYKRQMRVSAAQPRHGPGGQRQRQRSRRGAEPDGPCHIDALPPELLQSVLAHLSVREQLVTQRVCRRWAAASRDLLARTRELDLRAFPVLCDGLRLTDGVLRRLLRQMPALRRLRTGGSVRGLSYKALELVAEHCSQLEEVELDGFCINEETLKRLCVACPLLQEVHLPNHYHFSESSVWVLLRHLPNLRTLELNSSGRVTGKSFSLLPAALRKLSVSGCTGMKSDHLRQLVRCPELRELDVSGVPSLKAADLRAALTACPALERLTARKLEIAPEAYLPEDGHAALRHLDIGASEGVTDATLRSLPCLVPDLTSLNIQGCHGVTAAGLAEVRRLTRLTALDLSYLRPLSDELLDSLHGLPLNRLEVAEGFQGAAAFTAAGLTRVVLGCHTLTVLNVSCVDNVNMDMVYDLVRQLPSDRDVTIYTGGTRIMEVQGPPSGPLKLNEMNTVPLHMRGIGADLYHSDDSDFEPYDGYQYYDSDEDVYDDYEDFFDPAYAYDYYGSDVDEYLL